MKITNKKKKSVFARLVTAAMAVFMIAVVFSFSAVSVSAAEPVVESTVVAENLSLIELTEANAPITVEDGATYEAMSISNIQVMPLAGGAAGGAAAGGGSNAEATYQTVIQFFVTWFRRIGMVVAFIGAIMFALAIKNNDADQKQNGLVTMIAGFVVAAVCGAVDMFDLFT